MIPKLHRLKTLKLLYASSGNANMMDIIEKADLAELQEFCCVEFDTTTITNENLATLVASKRNLTTVWLFGSKSVTFASVRKIIEVIKSDVATCGRPHLKLNVNTIEIGIEEVIFILIYALLKLSLCGINQL